MAENYAGVAFTRIGAPIDNDQGGYQIVSLDNGNFVAVWDDNSHGVGDGTGDPADDFNQKAVRAQLFGPDGDPLGSAFLVNSTKPYDQFWPVVAALPGGGFVVAWETQSWDEGINALLTGIDAQVFDLSGNKVGAEIEILPTQSDGFMGIQIVATAGGGFAVTWNEIADTGADLDGSVHIRFVNDSLTPGAIQLVNTETHDQQWVASVAALNSGGVVVVWQDESAGLGTATDDSSGSAIRGQLFNSDGQKDGSEFLVNTATQDDQDNPTVIALAGGGFAIVWEDQSLGVGGASGDPAGRAIKAQVYDADANPVGGELLVNTAFVDDQELGERGTVTALADGGFVVVWLDWSQGVGGAAGDNSGTAVKAQIFNANGTKRGGEILVNATIAAFQDGPTVAALDDGGFVVGWNNGAGGTFNREINAQVFTANGAKIGTELKANIGTGHDGDVALAPVPGGGFAISYRSIVDDELYVRTFAPNDAPQLTGPTTFAIGEGQTSVATIAATDPNGHDLSYYIAGGADELNFSIDAVTGALSFLNAPDFETPSDADGDNVYNVAVSVTDIGGLTDSRTISVTVTNVNEAPTGVSLSKAVVKENLKAGTTVGALSIADPDGASAGFKLTSNPGGFFKIAGNKLQTAKKLDFETKKAHAITVEATDSGGETISKSFTIKVADIVDLLRGASKKDKLVGAKGADDIRGLGGADTLFGKGGKDILDGGRGNDLLVGGPGADRLKGGKGKDTASYQDATGKVVANLKNAKKNKGDAKGDTYGGIENLTGGKKADTLVGDDRANVLKGLGGNDRLVGGKGADTLEGGLDKDTLIGGGGADHFVFRAPNDSPAKKKAFDLITDFSRKQGDRIDLSAIDAKTGKKNQAFTFIEDNAFSGKKGELRYDKTAQKTFVYGDVDGDAKADFRIELSKAIDLKQGDFLL